MKNTFIVVLFVLITGAAYAGNGFKYVLRDSTAVIELNKQAFSFRLLKPGQTVTEAGKALEIAKQINYIKGLGESHRVIGIGYYYLDRQTNAIKHYLTALTYFEQVKDLYSEGKVYNNMGNVYRLNDYGLSLSYFNRSLAIALKLANNQLAANLYNNLGSVYYRQNSFTKALNSFNKSSEMFTTLKDSANVVQCAQNSGNIYLALHLYYKAEGYFVRANAGAKKIGLNDITIITDLALAQTYIAENKFKRAEKTIREGMKYAAAAHNDKLSKDFEDMRAQLSQKRKG
jgi:tetratricopeptide (TPR) repeat protein